MIKFRCSHCNKKFGVPDDYAGRRIRCNTCDHHTIVPGPVTDTTLPPSTQSTPDSIAVQPCGTACGLATALGCAANSNPADDELITAETLLKTQKSPDPEIQLQSFHQFTPSDSVVADPAPKPAAENAVTKLLKRCRPDPRTDRVELALNTLSFISCIGPFIFLIVFLMLLSSLFGGISDSVSAIPDPNSSAAEPNAISTSNPFSALPAFSALRYLVYAVCFVISPTALILSLILVFRYAFDIPKTLYVAIVFYGIIFLAIFRG
jgi:DNA-directed RNA polymerase subunit RPC12/RpoP